MAPQDQDRVSPPLAQSPSSSPPLDASLASDAPAQPSNPSAALNFPRFMELPKELRLLVWEAALAAAQRPRVLLSHCLKPVASESRGDVKTLAATCKESRAVTAKYHEECRAQAREASRSAIYTTHLHPATDICLARTSWFCMLGQRVLCPRIYKTLQRVMVPSKRWLEVVLNTSTAPSRFGLFARLLRVQFGTHITEITMLLPELPRTALWDLEGEPRRSLKRLPEESGLDWDGRNAVPRDLFCFGRPR